ATGKQGGAVIQALANNPSFNLLAQTRNATGSAAQGLKSKGSNIKIVPGDQDDVPALFKSAKDVAGGKLWGVYSVQVSQGKGVTHDGEIKQGKAMVDEAVKAGVKHFVYSSVERGGDETSWENETPIPHFQSKYHIEHHLKDNAGQMGWTILRPVAFMDNLAPGFPTQVFMAAMRDTLGSKSNQWVATHDIGQFVQLALENPQQYNHKALGLAGDELTCTQLSDVFEKTTGNRLDGTFWFLGSCLKYMVAELGTMITWFGSDGYKVKINELKKLHPGMMDMETWIKE
ncbi:putative NmrA-like family domain-containing protein 1, partial [Teratosphaeria nubilosa]